MFSTGLSSGHFGGSGRRVMFAGTTSSSDRCHPAWSSSSTACAPSATQAAISAKWRLIAALLQHGRTRAAPPACALGDAHIFQLPPYSYCVIKSGIFCVLWIGALQQGHL